MKLDLSVHKLIDVFVNSAPMNRVFRLLLLLLLAFMIISALRFLAVSRIVIMGVLLVVLIGTIVWILKKALK